MITIITTLMTVLMGSGKGITAIIVVTAHQISPAMSR